MEKRCLSCPTEGKGERRVPERGNSVFRLSSAAQVAVLWSRGQETLPLLSVLHVALGVSFSLKHQLGGDEVKKP